MKKTVQTIIIKSIFKTKISNQIVLKAIDEGKDNTENENEIQFKTKISKRCGLKNS